VEHRRRARGDSAKRADKICIQLLMWYLYPCTSWQAYANGNTLRSHHMGGKQVIPMSFLAEQVKPTLPAMCRLRVR
jgi:hypothetical protein